MEFVLIIIIVILICIACFQYKSIKNRNKSLIYMQEKLCSIISDSMQEKLMVFTDDKYIILILEQINNLLEYNQKINSNYIKTEMSMKKMLSNISHDLKTPLTVILGYIETIKLDDSLSSEEQEILLSKVENKSKELLALINKFFDLAKLESEDKDIPIARININEICRKNILAYYDILTNQGFEVNVDIPENSIYVLGNEEAIDRILNNLISNAIKYGDFGKAIGLKVSVDDSFAYVDVWDKGKGISELDKDRVFERMYTLEDSRNKSYEGSGLGLTITKRLIEKLGGEIILTSKAYEKTTFSVKLRRITY